AHHCPICHRCVLKSLLTFLPRHSHSNFETGINQRIGIHNEEQFVLFVAYPGIA
ncbi:hypothetical protein C8F01DRAFT_979918, partial [Mycena amicta]